MTVVVAFLCSDGVVVAADSMITPTMGGISVGHHHGKKISVLNGPQIFAFAGDQGQAARVQVIADFNHALAPGQPSALDYPLLITQAVVNQFNATGLRSFAVNGILAYLHGGLLNCCVFEGDLFQPRLLDTHHFYVALGSGKMSADPFLRFLVDIFCRNSQPNVREGIFLSTWAVQHVIETNPGGVAAPIRLAVFEKNDGGRYIAREVPDTEMEESKQAIESAATALLDWRKNIQTGNAAIGAPPVPPTP